MTSQDDAMLTVLDFLDKIVEPDLHIETVAAMCGVDVDDLKEIWKDE
jgi:hypothetical protein